MEARILLAPRLPLWSYHTGPSSYLPRKEKLSTDMSYSMIMDGLWLTIVAEVKGRDICEKTESLVCTPWANTNRTSRICAAIARLAKPSNPMPISLVSSEVVCSSFYVTTLDCELFLADDPTIKQIWDGEYNLVTNNCQNFVIQILKLLADESPPPYYRILLKEQGNVISKLWSVGNSTSYLSRFLTFLSRSYREIGQDPPPYVSYIQRGNSNHNM